MDICVHLKQKRCTVSSPDLTIILLEITRFRQIVYRPKLQPYYIIYILSNINLLICQKQIVIVDQQDLLMRTVTLPSLFIKEKTRRRLEWLCNLDWKSDKIIIDPAQPWTYAQRWTKELMLPMLLALRQTLKLQKHLSLQHHQQKEIHQPLFIQKKPVFFLLFLEQQPIQA